MWFGWWNQIGPKSYDEATPFNDDSSVQSNISFETNGFLQSSSNSITSEKNDFLQKLFNLNIILH